MIELLKTVGPILIGLGGITTAVLVYINTRGANRNVADKNKTDKYEVLDAKQEQIAEWGFKAADDANKRADRIAAEMQMTIADLREQLADLDVKLKKQVALIEEVRRAYDKEIANLRAGHQLALDQKDRRIVALLDALERGKGDRQTRGGERQTEEGKRQTIEGDRLDKMREDNDAQ